MAISTDLQYATLDELYLDAKNPRLGRQYSNPNLSQEEVLGLMSDWKLDELAISYLESGFWTYEALLVVEEELDGKYCRVVVEGNRRLAALIYLRRAFTGEKVSNRWKSLVENRDIPEELFNRVPYIQIDAREEIDGFLGFRHVTGIKQWSPEEKAQYIARLIDGGMSYEEVMRKIGSTVPTVRVHYISYQLLLQMETLPDFSPQYAEGRFSVMYLTLRKQGAQQYLQIDIMADPETAKKPIPEEHKKNLANFALWLFGNDEQPPLFEDSRQAENFNTILKSHEAVRYLEDSKKPNFERAFQLAGGDEIETVRLINQAADNIALSLSHVHRYKESQEIQQAVVKLSVDFKALLDRFPKLKEKFSKED